MLFRSSNAKFVHYGGDVVSNVDDGSSHGCHLTGGSTGAVFTAAGDEANIAARITGKGTAPTIVGNSSSPVTLAGNVTQSGTFTSTGITSTHISLNSTKVSFAGSTAFLIGMRRVFVEFTVPTMAVNAGAEVGDIAVTGLTTNAVVTMSPRGPINSSVAGVLLQSYCSSAGQLHITIQNAGTTITGSTQSAYAMIHDFNIPVP